jgi:4-amino-4-deoxy-L-arabinose transferase-like glycosyltransferase
MVLTPKADDERATGRPDATRRQAGAVMGRWLWPALVVACFCVPLFIGLGATDLDNDESGYSFAVEVMVRDGDWLTPKSSPFEDQPFLEKPPLKFWMVAAPIRLGLLPDNEFGLRFCDAVIGSLAFLYVFAIGRRLGGVVCGLVAVLVLFANEPLLFNHGLRSNNMEASVVLAYCGGVYHFLRWRVSDRMAQRAGHILAIALFFVLGFMTKFVAVFFLPLILGLMLLTGDDRRHFRRDWALWLAAAAIAVLLVAPWFLYQYQRYGSDLWNVMFGTHVYKRFTASVDPGHRHPWHYYFSMLFEDLRRSQMLTITLAGVLLVLWRTVRRGWREGALVMLWFALPLAIISAGTSKLYHYAYPFLPALALSAGYGAAAILRALRTVADRILRPADRAFRALVRRTRVLRSAEWPLLIIAVLSAAVAVGTWAQGGRLAMQAGDVLLFRNASIARPALVTAVALALAGRLVGCVRVAVPLLVLLILPVGAYRSHVALAFEEDHPLRTLRACLQPIAVSHAADDPRGLGVYIEDDLAGQAFHYYLRGLGRWFSRPAGTSDATVYTALYVPALMRPVLLSSARWERFVRLVDANDIELLERSARKAGMTPGDLRAAATAVPITVVRFPADVLLLPGPYSACNLPPGTARLR